MSEPEESMPTPPVKRSLSEQLACLHGEFHAPNYAPSLSLVKGKGAYVWDANGKKYLDFVSGIAVTALGHSHPAMVKAVKRQAGRLMHVSNLYFNDQAPFLAKQLCELAGLGGKVFFCNSGAEANEGMIKLARKWGSEQDRFEIITFRNSFHGRTLATLSATGQEKVQYGFAPLVEGFKYAQYNDLESVKAHLTPKTAAVMLELVQAEGGVIPADPEFVKELAKLCRERNLLLLVDEIQTGVGRTGTMFAWQGCGIEPDAFSLAKGLGGGFPVGAVMMGSKLKDVFQPGSHGTTFGGQPLGCAVARAVLDTIADKALDTNAEAMGYMLQSKLKKVVDTYSFVRAVRGRGLLIGLVIDRPAKDLEMILTRRGLLTVCTAGNVIRMLPPLTLTPGQVKQAVKIIDKACQEWQAELLNQQGN
jgi:predicted acetylornithine/succinylornithine family transaminase